MPVLWAEREWLNESPRSEEWDLPSLCSRPYHQLLFLKAKTAQVRGTSPSHTSGSTRRQREQEERKKYQLVSGSLRRLDCPFLPLFLQRHISISLGPFEAKLCQQSHTQSPCRGSCTSTVGYTMSPPSPGAPQLLPELQPPQLAERLVSVQLFAQPLTPALVNPGNARGEQPEQRHLGPLCLATDGPETGGTA